MFAMLMMSAKLATLAVLEIKVFWNKGKDIIIFVHDVTNNISPRETNYVVGVVMWPKFGNSRIVMREVIITTIL